MAHKEPTNQDGKPTVEQVEAKLLAERVALLFSPEPVRCVRLSEPHGSSLPKCVNSNCLNRHNQTVVPLECPIPDPVDITKLGPALEAYRKHKSKDIHIRMTTRFRVYCKAKGLDYETEKHDGDAEAVRWLLYEATAEQIWEICVLAVESEGDK